MTTPELNPDADPQRAADYAAQLAAAKSLKDVARIHDQFADIRKPKSLRDEIRSVIAAPKDSDVAKARSTLGWSLILFGLIGVPILIAVILVIAALLT
ncbi:hypothetical protein G1H11_16100 [Phytoactinopolyspora alkaliphila]|uniref:Uncharacterized protein n=1 Tax=Phytoactinopolyspora alkaliphila TaxID=1783498 RepID=A0A6N9YP42_9ACTN|nr:hypothetical protein [Phytoactinopolyspora alkaliphila]NED96831.1 hypothetical protein [Phytoactinopolyspora alkaliphila]